MSVKRMVVLLLGLGLAGLGIYGWSSGTTPPQVLGLLAFAVALSVVFALRGSLPGFVHHYADIQRDDDPGNIPPRVYLPLVLIALLVAAGLLIWTLRR